MFNWTRAELPTVQRELRVGDIVPSDTKDSSPIKRDNLQAGGLMQQDGTFSAWQDSMDAKSFYLAARYLLMTYGRQAEEIALARSEAFRLAGDWAGSAAYLRIAGIIADLVLALPQNDNQPTRWRNED
jgi:hypothetical protein